MDSKKRLQEAYTPDKEGRKEKVVIGLSGGIDSKVAAYLLKIQKYDLVAVTVINSWDAYPEDQIQTMSCHIGPDKLNQIKEFCHSLSIPHIVVKAGDEFYESVVEKWMGSRLTGTKSLACWSCHELRMRILSEKMKEVHATKIATGHFAKIFQHESHGTVYVHSSNDDHYDQSAYLSRLPHDLLSHLMLPLSDLQHKEVLKLAENFGVKDFPKNVEMHRCFDQDPKTIKFIESKVPASFLKPGPVIGLATKEEFGEHLGIINYQYGKDVLPTRMNPENLLRKFSLANKALQVANADAFLKNEIHLVKCKLSEETPWHEPFKGVLKLADGEYVDCWIHPKSLNSAAVTWEGKYKVLEKDIVSVYKKRGKNAKVFLTGVVRFLPEIKEDKNEIEKVDYSSDL